MNLLKSMVVSLLIIPGLIMSGCSKEDASRDPDPVSAVFTLGGSPGACTGFVLGAGTYVAGIALGATNTVKIDVNVTTAGNYSISTATANGIKFSASGSFSTTGAQTVTLTGSGTPTAAGANSYGVTAGSNTCTFNITATGGSTGVAAFTLGGSPGNCTGFTLGAGTYVVGTSVGATNTVTLQVNVTTAGTYSITTATVNGVSFSKSGTFAATGAQNVTLVATGTPTAAGSFNYPATAGANSCTFSISATGGASGSVQFSACDDLNNWEIAGDKPKGLQTTGQKEGTGWLEADLVNTVDYMHFIHIRPTPLNGNVTEANGQLKFWFYITDVTQIRPSGVGVDPGQIELTSAGISDFKEYSWSTDLIIPLLHNGWNEIKLDFSAAEKSADGGPDLTKFNLFRIYFWTKSLTHTDMQIGIDDVRIQSK